MTRIPHNQKPKDILRLMESIYTMSCVLHGQNLDSEFLLNYIKNIKRVIRTSISLKNTDQCLDYIIRFSSKGQLKSKVWLIDTLKSLKLFHLGTVFTCAGWCGSLAYLLFQEKDFIINKIFNFDKDPLSIQISEDLNREYVKEDWKFKAGLEDIFNLDYCKTEFETLKKNGEPEKQAVSADTIINTSCEHIKGFQKWWDKIPEKKLIILQSNNFFQHEGHDNCVSSLEAFKKQADMDYLYAGGLNLDQYQRFMLIGYKRI